MHVPTFYHKSFVLALKMSGNIFMSLLSLKDSICVKHEAYI